MLRKVVEKQPALIGSFLHPQNGICGGQNCRSREANLPATFFDHGSTRAGTASLKLSEKVVRKKKKKKNDFSLQRRPTHKLQSCETKNRQSLKFIILTVSPSQQKRTIITEHNNVNRKRRGFFFPDRLLGAWLIFTRYYVYIRPKRYFTGIFMECQPLTSTQKEYMSQHMSTPYGIHFARSFNFYVVT